MALKHLTPDEAKAQHKSLTDDGWERYATSPIQHSYRRPDDHDGLGEMPHASELRGGGYKSRADVFAATDEELLAVTGIGPKALEAIRAEQA